MGSLDSWIDPEEISQLAGEVFPSGGGRSMADGEGFRFVPVKLLDDGRLEVGVSGGVGSSLASVGVDGAGGEGAGGEARRRMGAHLRVIRTQAERVGLLGGGGSGVRAGRTEGEGEGEVTRGAASALLPGGEVVFEVRGCSLAERVVELVGWLDAQRVWSQVFLADELGDDLAGGKVVAGVRSAAVRLAQSWERSGRWLEGEGYATTAAVAGARLVGGEILSVVGARLRGSFFCVGVVGERMLEEGEARDIQAALVKVFS